MSSFIKRNLSVSVKESPSRDKRTKFEDTSEKTERSSIQIIGQSADIFRNISEAILNALGKAEKDEIDPNVCYHSQCCFAYNIAGDVRKAALIAECLPLATYQRLATLWNMDPRKTPHVSGNICKIKEKSAEEDEMVEEFIRNVERDIQMRTDISQDLHVQAVSNESEEKEKGKKDRKPRPNPYLKLLRELQVLSSRRSDSSIALKQKIFLGKKAGKITKMIIKNFLEWYRSLGGNDGDTFIEESTLEDLFQIGCETPAAQALAIKIKEMPTVPEGLALIRNMSKHATTYGLRQLLKHDIKMENIPTKMFAFGSMLPKEMPSLRYKPPRNFVQKTWMECSRVSHELDSMQTVWQGLERLRSTIAFCNWCKNHPEIKPPAYLKEQGLLNINYEEWNQMYKGFEVDAESIEAAMSDLKLVSSQEYKYGEETPDVVSFGSSI